MKGWSFGALIKALRGAAFLDVGTAANTVAAGNDSRIVNALQKGNNLSDVSDKATSRTSLELGTADNVTFGTFKSNSSVEAVTFVRAATQFQIGSDGRTNLSAGSLLLGGTQAGQRSIALAKTDGGALGMLYGDTTTEAVALFNGTVTSSQVILAKDYSQISSPGGISVTLRTTGTTLNGDVAVTNGGISVAGGVSCTSLTSSNTISAVQVNTSGNVVAGNVCCSGNGSSYLNTDGNVYGPVWGGWLYTWIYNNFIPRNIGWSDLSAYCMAFYTGGGQGGPTTVISGGELIAADADGGNFGQYLAGTWSCRGAFKTTNNAHRTTLWYRQA